MDSVNSWSNDQQQTIAALSQHQVLPISEAMVMAVGGVEEKMNYVGAVDSIADMAFSASGGECDPNGKRKRGRPRKQEVMETSTAETKRARGRPKGSGKWQTLAATLSGSALQTAGSNFTPHTITIMTGEDIVQTIGSFTQKLAESICILSASGAVSFVELLKPGSLGDVKKYKGTYDIVSLSGSYVDNGSGGVKGKKCLLSVQLADQDGSVLGGAVGGSLVAGGPIQVVLATFKMRPREKAKEKRLNQVAVTAPLQTTTSEQLSAAEANGLQGVSHAPVQSIDAVEKFIESHDNHASSQIIDWGSLQNSAPASQYLMLGFDNGTQ